VSEISEKNASLELERCLRFWELKEHVLEQLRYASEISKFYNWRTVGLEELIEEIESISAYRPKEMEQ
jgi:hypothetical protein